MLAIVTVFVPNLPVWVGPLVLSVLVVGFAFAWPTIVSSHRRWGVTAGLAGAGLVAIWSVTLLPINAEFSTMANELWLAPVGGAAALGVLAMFVIQTFTLPGGLKRFLTTATLAVGAIVAATSAGWTLLLRHKYEAAAGSLGLERISGVTWLMLTMLAALAVAALVTLLPARRRTRMVAIIVVATVVAVALQFFRPGPLSVPAVLASAITALIVGLTDSFSETQEVAAKTLQHPLTAVAAGSATTMVSGMVAYFVIHVLPW
ncbi:hypothetical protein GCM10009720_11580 [Yaniella flava]|uniref:Uncharacterized protein n=1 Tax=Yaniella flava TaxID=287930 RepID=A0ABN2UBA2_9MICC